MPQHGVFFDRSFGILDAAEPGKNRDLRAQAIRAVGHLVRTLLYGFQRVFVAVLVEQRVRQTPLSPAGMARSLSLPDTRPHNACQTYELRERPRKVHRSTSFVTVALVNSKSCIPDQIPVPSNAPVQIQTAGWQRPLDGSVAARRRVSAMPPQANRPPGAPALRSSPPAAPR